MFQIIKKIYVYVGRNILQKGMKLQRVMLVWCQNCIEVFIKNS